MSTLLAVGVKVWWCVVVYTSLHSCTSLPSTGPAGKVGVFAMLVAVGAGGDAGWWCVALVRAMWGLNVGRSHRDDLSHADIAPAQAL